MAKKGGAQPKVAWAVEEFAQGIASGLTQREAWRRSHPKSRCKNNVADVKACEFSRRADVIARIAELRAENAERSQITRDELVGMLSAEIRMCYAEAQSLAPVMKQVDCLTRVCGFDRQTLDIKAEVGAANDETVAEKINFLIGKTVGRGARK